MKKVLSVETSCDDTCVAVVQEDGFVLYSYQQDQDETHRPFGGVVPERASRNHSRYLLPLIDQILKKEPMDLISLLAYTNRPGLLGSLLVGSVTTKTLAMLYQKPMIAVNHIEGHILSPFLHDKKNKKNSHWDFPYLALVVSGGHTHLFSVKNLGQYTLLGQTLDDAAGEAFDKLAQMLHLRYPQGKEVDQLAKKGERDRFLFPVALLQKGNLNFSFSGLKTSARLFLEKMDAKSVQKETPSICASYQESIVNQIIFKLDQCIVKHPHQRVAIVGGVSSNSRLRNRCTKWAKERSIQLMIPPVCYCTDNAAMIGYAGLSRFLKNGETSDLSTVCLAHHKEKDFIGLS